MLEKEKKVSLTLFALARDVEVKHHTESLS